MSRQLTLLCVHGVSHSEIDPDFQASWTKAITSAVESCVPDVRLAIDFLEYDDLFDKAPLNLATYTIALGKLLASGALHGITDLFTRTRGITDLPEVLKWTAGMVAQWSTDTELRQKLRETVSAKMDSKSYDVILAHSLGSLICYDAFVRNPEEIKGKVFVSFGSQIGNPAVRDVFAGRIEALASRMWYHLFNPDDHVLTGPIRIAADNFVQVTEPFDIPNDMLNHSATAYLSHANTIAGVWSKIAADQPSRAFAMASRAIASVARPPDRRALLVGINNYPDPANILEGCVNDVFLMSSVLQESGFEPEEIRVVLDDRATTEAIMERLHWLLDGVQDDDQRVLFYSGHGAQIPGYDIKGEPDHVDECLVPYDFDWSSAHAIRDKTFCELYSQLPYGCYFVAMFDCCHSGGMTRDGGPRIRGLTPPDDIRHRMLRWDRDEDMWVARKLPSLNEKSRRQKDRARICRPKRYNAPVRSRHDASNQAGQRVRQDPQGAWSPRALSADPARGLPGAGAVLRIQGRRNLVRRLHIFHGKGVAGAPRSRGQPLFFGAQRARDAKAASAQIQADPKPGWPKEHSQTAVTVGQTGEEGAGQDFRGFDGGS